MPLAAGCKGISRLTAGSAGTRVLAPLSILHPSGAVTRRALSSAEERDA